MADFNHIVTSWLPTAAGLVLVVLFTALAGWQLERAAEKEELESLFANTADPVALDGTGSPALYQPVRATGRYLPDRQVLIDNIIRDRQVGYYVITPFETAGDGRLLLVNRGWIAKEDHGEALPAVDIDGGTRHVLARAGRLPRVAIRSDEPFADSGDWPRVATYPALADVEEQLGRDLAEPVLLLAAGEPDGYRRDWQPAGSGPSMHYGYAFQWGALAATVLVILAWHWRKRLKS